MSKERKLDKLYAEFDRDYSGKSEEEMAKTISDLEKEVAGKESSLEGLEGEKLEKLQKDIEQKKMRIENLRGYAKNKTQIEGIRKYRDSLVKKLEQETIVRDKSIELFKEAHKSLKEVNKKLADEKYTKTLDQYEYNELLEEQARLDAEVKKQAKRHMDAKNRVVELQGKISKCNLAWKTLFVNKDWDEIQKRALSDKTRFTRKIDHEKSIPLSPKKREKESAVSKEESDVRREISDVVEEVLNEKAEDKDAPEKEETKALVEKKEGFFKRIWNKLANLVKRKDKSTKEGKDESKDKEEKATTSVERDTFLEGLRQHVDKEYRDSVREEKETQYKEAHKVQPKEHKEEEESR